MRVLTLASLALVLAVGGCKRTMNVAHGKTAEQWAEVMKTAEKPSERGEALMYIGMICEHEPEAVEYLVLGIQDPVRDNRVIAIKKLESLGATAKPAIPALAAVKDDPEVGFDAANAISVIEGKGPLERPTAPKAKR